MGFPLTYGRGSKRTCRVWGACRVWGSPPPSRSGLQKSVSCLGSLSCLGIPPPSRSGLQKSVSCLGCLSCLGIPPSLTVGAPKELVVSCELVVSGDSPLPHGWGSKRACRALGACRVWGFPPPLRSGLQKSVSCLGSLSCLGIPPSLTVGAPKERVVSCVLVVPCDSPLPYGRGSKRACRVQGPVKPNVMNTRAPKISRSYQKNTIKCCLTGHYYTSAQTTR